MHHNGPLDAIAKGWESTMNYIAPLDGMKSFARTLVSKQKRRYKENGFDLDLSYITPRIIAMGFPSEGAEGIFRNALSEVTSFLTRFHEKHFKVFNLCAERSYDPAKLGGNVEWLPFADHNPAPTSLMFRFCAIVHEWLLADPNNIIVVHCKAGKGRTGVMICAYLIYSRECSDPVVAMQYYGEKRTKNGKGVTIPSQRRYIFYFYQLWQCGLRSVPSLQLLKVVLYSNISFKSDIQMRVSCNSGNDSYQLSPILDSVENGFVTNLIRDGKSTSFFFSEVWILGDVKIEIYDAHKKSTFFYFWFNTAFVEGDVFSLMSKSELDKPSKKLEADTQIHMYFTPRPRGKQRRDVDPTAKAEMKTIEQLTKQLASIMYDFNGSTKHLQLS